MGDEPRRQRTLTSPRLGLPPGVRVGPGAELGPLRQLAVTADQGVGGDVTDLFQVGRPDELTRFGRDDIRQPVDSRGQPEPLHETATIRPPHLLIGPVDAPGGQPAGAFTGVMLGHDTDDPAAGPYSGPGHACPRRGAFVSGRGGRGVFQVHGQSALTAISRHRRVPGDLLQVPEQPRSSRALGTGSQLEPREPERLHREHGHAVADPAEPRRLDLAPRGRVRGDHDHGKIGTVVPHRVGPPSRGQHVNLGRLADIQPHPHRDRPRQHVRRGQHQARPDQVS